MMMMMQKKYDAQAHCTNTHTHIHRTNRAVHLIWDHERVEKFDEMVWM